MEQLAVLRHHRVAAGHQDPRQEELLAADAKRLVEVLLAPGPINASRVAGRSRSETGSPTRAGVTERCAMISGTALSVVARPAS